MKLSDYIFEFLKEKKVSHIFMLPGGGAMHLVDSLGKSDIEYTCLLHEQAVAIAAEAYGQHTNMPGVALVTSGPGGTNTITGITAGWLDSTPMLVITGQSKRADLVGEKGVRQIGSQEVQIVDIVKPITKYAKQVMDPDKIRYYLDKAWYMATSSRPGPVLLDIPLDIQAAEIDVEKLERFKVQDNSPKIGKEELDELCKLLLTSKKPIMIVGNGIKIANAAEELYEIVKNLKIPVLTTWKTADMFSETDMNYCGHPGIMGDRGANFIVQESDLIISIGSRLDNSITAFNEPNFGKNAKKIIIDIDENEIERLNMNISMKFVLDAKYFLNELKNVMNQYKEQFSDKQSDYEAWLKLCHNKRAKYPCVKPEINIGNKEVSAYDFVECLSDKLTENDIIVPESSGGAGEITYQAIRIKKGQKMKNAAALGSMGFGLPYAIGSCIANSKKRTVLINGDGAFQLNIQELATLELLQLPIKIFIWSNGGYASIRNMQRNNFGGNYVGSDHESGLALPDIIRVAEAYQIKTFEISDKDQMESVIEEVLSGEGPAICKVNVPQDETVSPRIKTKVLPDGNIVSDDLDHMWPYIEEDK